MTTLFISDLHLDSSRPEATALFLDFLRTEARRAEALYILGDFFEAWIGDDAPTDHDREVMEGLRALSDTGVPIFFMHGNRDFLIGRRFARETGCRLIDDPAVIELYGAPTLLTHGDALCTDDVEYQQFRQMVRSREWQDDFLAKPVAERRAFAEAARAESARQGREKGMEIMDVNAGAVEEALNAAGVDHMIHGHTHRPDTHRFRLDDRECSRIVLGDWYDQGSVLRCNEAGCRLEVLPHA